MAHINKRDNVMARFNEAIAEVKTIYQADSCVHVSEEKEIIFWEALSRKVGAIKSDISNYKSTSPPVQPAHDATLRQMVSSFYQNGLWNLLRGVPQEIDQVTKHVLEVTMAMHKQAYKMLWGLVEAVLNEVHSAKACEVKSILINEFLPTFRLQSSSNEMEDFKEWFQIVHCGPEEPHPPADVKSILNTINAVLKIRNKGLEVQNPDYTALHGQLSTDLKANCQNQLEKNSMLKMHVPNNLPRLASEICEVVSAMLLHSSPIIPFTRLKAFFSAYHEPTRYAREDPNGRSVLVYRTPYVYYYHCGELKTVHRASVIFEIPAEKLSTSLPNVMEQNCQRDPNNVDCRKANTKTDVKANSGNPEVTMRLQKDSEIQELKAEKESTAERMNAKAQPNPTLRSTPSPLQPIPAAQPTPRSPTTQVDRHSIEPVKATPQVVHKPSDEELMKMVHSFFYHSLDNFLVDVPEAEDGCVWKHVQEVIMDMHKQAYEHIWGLVKSQLWLGKIWSLLVKEFFPTIDLPVPTTDSEQRNAFEDWFRKVHCSRGELHPPADVRTSLSTRNSVLRVKEEVVKELKMNSEKLHQTLRDELQRKCQEKLKSNTALNTYIKKEKLSGLVSQIIEVVSAMLLHSSPIIPFTGLPFFFSAYHQPTRYAREDPNGRSVLVYRTPYLYFYHYGELKTVHRASVTFEIPPEKSVSSPRPTMQKEDLCKVVRTFFIAEKTTTNFAQANRKTDAFVTWYHFANGVLTSAMLHSNKVTESEYSSLTSGTVKPTEFPCGNNQLFITAFEKRYRLLAEDPNLLASSGLRKKLRDQTQKTNPEMKQEELDEAVQLVIDLLSSPMPLIPFGVKDAPYYQPQLHCDINKNHRQHQQVTYYLRPLLWSPAANANLLKAYVA